MCLKQCFLNCLPTRSTYILLTFSRFNHEALKLKEIEDCNKLVLMEFFHFTLDLLLLARSGDRDILAAMSIINIISVEM